ncbi:SecA DEAD-like domain-containing protein [Haematococcus lacustris]
MRTAPMGKRRVLERYCAVLEQINALEPRMRQHSDAQLTALTADFKSRLARGASLDDLLPEAFAAIREVARRVLGMRHFDSQMIGGMVLHDGQIAEMATGEGKTLVATLPAYLNALTGSSVHVVTVNEYLAARDAQWMGKVFSFMGLSCAAVSANMTTTQYKAAYACDITYVTGQELGFAYLRDNTARSEFEVMLPARLHYAIVDEADSILIDESRNPMIISLPVAQNAGAVLLVDKVVRPIWTQLDAQSRAISEQERRSLMTLYQGRLDEARLQAVEKRCREVADAYKALVIKVDLKARSITLTPEGAAEVLRGLVEEGVVFRAAQEEGREPSVTDMFEDPGRWGQLALTAFRAYELHTRGKQYIVKDGRVIIVDEHTGRLRDITRWQEGLHQAVEAKEDVSIKEEAQPTATITFQIFFGYYAKLAGMTGTAAPAAAELFELYGLKVVQVPTNRPRQRKDLPCRFYFDPEQKAAALCSIVQRAWATGRPVLIGTTSVQESERVLQQLLQGTTASWSQRHQAAIQVLNATPEKVRQESQIVAQAGLPGSVTIATNMAGRGTDIILGGSPEGLTKMALLRLVYRHMMTDEESELLAPLPAQLQSGPLGAYDCDDLQQALQAVSQGADSGQQGAGLPLPVYTALAAAMLLAHSEADLQRNRGGGSRRRAGRQGPQPISYETAVARAKWCIDQAYGIRREAYERVREAYNGLPQEQLEWSTCIAPLLADVLAEREHLMASAPQGQQFAAKAALFLWAWLDRECARWGAEVRAAGGLLVVGTSVQESRRIELQLRGRAGRQGDPGMTVFLYDISDPYMAIYNVNGIFNMVQQLDQSSGQVGTYVDGALVDTLVAGTQRSLEAAYSNARLEMKRYDQVVEDYRHSVYALRRIILLGSVQQRTQVLYMFIQFWVDELVARLLGSGRTSPDAWLHPSLPLTSLPRAVRAAAAAQEVAGALPTQPGVSRSGSGGQDTHHNSDRSSINSNSSGGGGGRGSNGTGSGVGGQPGGAGGQGSAHPGSVAGLAAVGQGPGVGGGSVGGGGLVSPLEALLRHVEVLVNPSGQALRPQWQLAEVQVGGHPQQRGCAAPAQPGGGAAACAGGCGWPYRCWSEWRWSQLRQPLPLPHLVPTSRQRPTDAAQP